MFGHAPQHVCYDNEPMDYVNKVRLMENIKILRLINAEGAYPTHSTPFLGVNKCPIELHFSTFSFEILVLKEIYSSIHETQYTYVLMCPININNQEPQKSPE